MLAMELRDKSKELHLDMADIVACRKHPDVKEKELLLHYLY